MAKRRIPAGLRGTTETKPRCNAIPPWINRKASDPPPRLLCKLSPDHKRKHVNHQDHSWDGDGVRRSARK